MELTGGQQDKEMPPAETYLTNEAWPRFPQSIMCTPQIIKWNSGGYMVWYMYVYVVKEEFHPARIAAIYCRGKVRRNG